MPQKHKAAVSPHQAPAKDKPEAPKANWLLTVLMIASIAVVIVGILLLKDRQQPAVALSAVQGSRPTAASPLKPSSPADQLNQALSAGQPVLVFMHSTNCQSCIDMMQGVGLYLVWLA